MKVLLVLVLVSSTVSTVAGDVLYHRLPNQILVGKDELGSDLQLKTRCSLVDVHVLDVVVEHSCLEVVHRSFST